MPIPPIPPYIPSYGNIPNVTPFTFRDGLSYEQRFIRLVSYLNTTIIPYISENVDKLGDEFTTEVNRLIEEFNAALESVGESNEAAEAAAAAAQASAALAATYASDAADIQDTAITSIFNNLTSAFRIAADAAYPTQAEFDALKAVIDTGRLSVATLDTRFAYKADAEDLDAEVEAREDADEAIILALNGKASIATQTTVESGRLSAGTLDGRFQSAEQAAIPAKLGGDYEIPFDYLKNGVINNAQDTRVYVLGSSNANASQGIYAYQPEQTCFERMSYRCSNEPMTLASAIVSSVGNQGMHWVNGAIGNTRAADYFPTSRKNVFTYLQPHYVFHQIGENNYYDQTPIATYKADLKAQLEWIESANAGTWNILIHSPGRHDVVSPTISWDAYGQAMRELAEEQPGRRYFIDTTEYFKTLGMLVNDKQNMFYDSVHLNESGHTFEANIISAKLGIPSDSDYSPQDMVKVMPFPNDGSNPTYSATGTVCTLAIDPARYPREVTIEGQVYVNMNTTTGFFTFALYDVDGAVYRESKHYYPGSSGVRSVPGSASFYLKPGTRYEVHFRFNSVSGSTTTILMSIAYTGLKCHIKAI